MDINEVINLAISALGKAAINESFYWIPFATNVVVYGAILYRIFKEFTKKG